MNENRASRDKDKGEQEEETDERGSEEDPSEIARLPNRPCSFIQIRGIQKLRLHSSFCHR
ncbi:hypothetical protein COLO4_12792 [Corchorus olitorius]|uniref:Uncharacterized protein n=1 Tax=Corchorus olitorius TaxID=93759 RepID=A0A1R3JZJ8_9ROSI|nr:hypothetical protein COLO4_12792 [Corchorus olitorius]